MSMQLTMLLPYCSQYYESHILPFNPEQGMFLCLSTAFFSLGRASLSIVLCVSGSSLMSGVLLLPIFFLALSGEGIGEHTPVANCTAFLQLSQPAFGLLGIDDPDRVTGPLYT